MDGLLDNMTGVLGTAWGMGMDVYNAVQGKKTQDYLKEVQKKTWEREDNATQRRVADLKAAGLSPTLAAGSAASTSSPINVGVPRFDSGNVMRGIEFRNAIKQGALTDAQRDLVETQKSNADASGWTDRMFVESMIKDASGGGRKSYDYLMSIIDKKIAENKEVQRSSEDYIRNSNIAREAGVSTNSQEAIDTINMSKFMNVDNATKPWLNTILGIIKSLR